MGKIIRKQKSQLIHDFMNKFNVYLLTVHDKENPRKYLERNYISYVNGNQKQIREFLVNFPTPHLLKKMRGLKRATVLA